MIENAFRMVLADRIIEIHCIHNALYRKCKDYLLSGYDNKKTDILVTLHNEDIVYEKSKPFTTKTKTKNGESDSLDDAYYESLAAYRKICEIMPSFNTFLMHGSVIAYNGWGYMFIAPSGVGKTTRTRLWLNEYPKSIVINGDKPLLSIVNEHVYAYGTPWSGKENWNTNTSIQLRAIFVLERTHDDEESSIQELRLSEAYPYLISQTYLPFDKFTMRKTLTLLKTVGERVKVYLFRSTYDSKSIRLAYETAKPKENYSTRI